MKLSYLQRRRIRYGIVLCLLVIGAILGLRAYLRSPNRGLPYHDSYAKGQADEWKAFGGTWELVNGTMRNDSDGRGAKLLTGSHYWHNYSIESDVYLLGGSGDAGLIIRANNAEEGVNSYSGYYAGIRTRDNSLVLGRADHGWLEVTKRLTESGGALPFRWHHLKLLAYDCQIAITATLMPSGTRTFLGFTDPHCIESGRAGLRSYSSGGIWRNVVVRPATYEDLEEMAQSLKSQNESAASGVETGDIEILRAQIPSEEGPKPPQPESAIRSIASLRLVSYVKRTIATISGVVILTAPRLYVQDSTGGVYISDFKAHLLKVGDEVEVTGEVRPGDFSSTMEHATVQVLWARTPVPPVSVTAYQASTGKYDATFIELTGHLAGKELAAGNMMVLDLDEGSQSFRAMMNSGRGSYLFNKLKPGSSLRLRGICVVDPALTHNLTPFVLLLRSSEDITVIAGPPWWSARHVTSVVVIVLLLALIINFVYNRIVHWRLHGVMEERQRLADEMHDTLAQSFAGIGFQLQAIRNGIPGENTHVLNQLDLAASLVRHSHEEARRSIVTLRSESMGSEDVLSALEICAKRMVEGGVVGVVSEREGEQRPVPLRIVDALYRIGQEAIANAVRHANPTVLRIRLKYDQNHACLQIEDNGKGFAKSDEGLGLGIRGMRRRARGISAKIEIHSTPGAGTCVQISAPLSPRVTLTNWPKLFWKYGSEHWIDVRPSKQAHSHPYRG